MSYNVWYDKRVGRYRDKETGRFVKTTRIWYDPKADRYRDKETGQFVKGKEKIPTIYYDQKVQRFRNSKTGAFVKSTEIIDKKSIPVRSSSGKFYRESVAKVLPIHFDLQKKERTYTTKVLVTSQTGYFALSPESYITRVYNLIESFSKQYGKLWKNIRYYLSCRATSKTTGTFYVGSVQLIKGRETWSYATILCHSFASKLNELILRFNKSKIKLRFDDTFLVIKVW